MHKIHKSKNKKTIINNKKNQKINFNLINKIKNKIIKV